MDSLAAPGREAKIPTSLAAAFVRAAFRGTAYPFAILQRALLRERAEAGGDDWIDSVRRDARAALLKAVLNRRLRFDKTAVDRYSEVDKNMDPTNTNIGYNLGALLAVLERLQAAALNDVNARERGLKHPARAEPGHGVAPSRKRGLKLTAKNENPEKRKVAPSRERGSKQ